MGENWGKKTKPKTTAFKQLLFTVCTEPGGQSIPVQRPQGAGCDTDTHTHTQPRLMIPPRLPRLGSGESAGAARLCGAEVEHRPGESRSGAGGRGPESPCPRALGSRQEGEPASSRAWSPGTRLGRAVAGPKRLWQSRSVLVPCWALPAAWEAPQKHKVGVKRSCSPRPTPRPDALPWGLGSTSRGWGRAKAGGLQSQLGNQLKSHGHELQAGPDCARHGEEPYSHQPCRACHPRAGDASRGPSAAPDPLTHHRQVLAAPACTGAEQQVLWVQGSAM